MSIQMITDVISPPDHPIDVGGDEDKERVENSFGVQLPDDYWEFAKRYGSGRVVTRNCDIIIYNPFSPVFRECVEADCDTLRTLKAKWSDDVPFAVFPDRPGLFPWGNDVNGGTIYWLTTEGDANSWPILVWPEGGDAAEFQQFDMSMTVFLAKAVRGDIICRMWDDAKAFADRSAIRFEPTA